MRLISAPLHFMSDEIRATFPSLLSDVREQLVGRYLAVSAIVIIVFDTLLSIQGDYNIWTTHKQLVPKMAYFAYRYLMLVAVATYLISTFPTKAILDNGCDALAKMISVTMFSADGIGHFLVVFRTFTLWERKPIILRLLLIGSLLANGVSCAFLVLSAKNVSAPAVFNTCAGQSDPKYALGIWISQAVFDLYVLLLVSLNAMDRPRLTSQGLMSIIYRDGVLMIMCTWVVRMANVAVCLRNDDTLPAISLSLSESLITTINLRLLGKTFQSEMSLREERKEIEMELCSPMKN